VSAVRESLIDRRGPRHPDWRLASGGPCAPRRSPRLCHRTCTALVGAGGFEPPNTGSKVPRLTAWPRPSTERRPTAARPTHPLATRLALREGWEHESLSQAQTPGGLA